jgi:hypothetical protein
VILEQHTRHTIAGMEITEVPWCTSSLFSRVGIDYWRFVSLCSSSKHVIFLDLQAQYKLLIACLSQKLPYPLTDLSMAAIQEA